MKKIFASAAACFLLAGVAKGQAPVGLDSIVVEKYYVSDLADKAVDATGGTLPVNSVTYRVYVDMKPGYKFQAVYGVDVSPTGIVSPGDHQLRIATNTLFFNNIDRGAVTPAFTKTQAATNTVMLDSWVSVGGACNAQMGVLKTEDNGVSNAVNSDGVLLNNNAEAGIPLTTQDGFLSGTPEAVTQVGISNDLLVFDNATTGNLISTYNGSWASLNGSVGPTTTNRVLVAQITTNGALSFQLNVQLGTPTPGGVENWVANSPVGNEGTHPTLTYLDSLHATSVKPVVAAAGVFSVYPNPASESLTISVSKASQSADNAYTVYGVDGRIVTSKKIGSISDNYQEHIDLSAVAPGLYFVELTLDGVRSTRKITKN